jgi:hypothetical protein
MCVVAGRGVGCLQTTLDVADVVGTLPGIVAPVIKQCRPKTLVRFCLIPYGACGLTVPI